MRGPSGVNESQSFRPALRTPSQKPLAVSPTGRASGLFPQGLENYFAKHLADARCPFSGNVRSCKHGGRCPQFAQNIERRAFLGHHSKNLISFGGKSNHLTEIYYPITYFIFPHHSFLSGNLNVVSLAALFLIDNPKQCTVRRVLWRNYKRINRI